jgi:hypothetical protein
VPEDLDMHVVTPGEQRHESRHLTRLGVVGKTVVHLPEPRRVETCTHAVRRDGTVMRRDASGTLLLWRPLQTWSTWPRRFPR